MDKKPVTKSGKYKISFLILLILAALTFAILFNEFNFNEITNEIINSSHKQFLLLAGAMSLLYLMLYGRFIGICIRAFQEKTTHFKCFLYGCADFFYSAITPSASGGQPVVIYLMAKDGVSYSTSAIAVILQTIAFKVVLLLFNLLSLFFIWDIVEGASFLFRILLILGVVMSLISISLCLASMYRPKYIGKAGRIIIRFLAKIHLIKHEKAKIESFNKTLLEYQEAAYYLKNKMFLLARLLFVTLLQRSAMFSIAFFVYKSFGLSDYSFIEFLCIQALVSLAIDSVPLPGSMGANEYATYLLYGQIYGSNDVIAATAMLLTRSFTFYFPLLFTSIFILGKQASLHFKAEDPVSLKK